MFTFQRRTLMQFASFGSSISRDKTFSTVLSRRWRPLTASPTSTWSNKPGYQSSKSLSMRFHLMYCLQPLRTRSIWRNSFRWPFHTLKKLSRSYQRLRKVVSTERSPATTSSKTCQTGTPSNKCYEPFASGQSNGASTPSTAATWAELHSLWWLARSVKTILTYKHLACSTNSSTTTRRVIGRGLFRCKCSRRGRLWKTRLSRIILMLSTSFPTTSWLSWHLMTN